MKNISIALVLAVFVFSSCKKNLPDVGGTAAERVANEWWVTVKVGGVDQVGHVKIATYNTSANNNEIWVDDLEHIWQFKVKATVDYNNLTFSANNAANEYYPITVNLANGKVIEKGGHSKSGNVTDSIYMEAKFSDDPAGDTYVISGHARTRFAEDDY